MPRFYLPSLAQGALVTIRGADAHHIRDVLRLKPGDGIRLWDDAGKEFQGLIKAEGPGQVAILVERRLPRPRQDPAPVLLGQALPKGAKMDLVVQKAAELGAAAVIPFFSMRSLPRLSPDKRLARRSRLQRLAYEAAKQCGRLSQLVVEEFCSFEELLEKGEGAELKIIFWEEEKECSLGKILTRPRPKSILLAVGPEGGFAWEEVRLAKERGFISVSLGPRILRTETAGLAVLSIFQYIYGDLG